MADVLQILTAMVRQRLGMHLQCAAAAAAAAASVQSPITT